MIYISRLIEGEDLTSPVCRPSSVAKRSCLAFLCRILSCNAFSFYFATLCRQCCSYRSRNKPRGTLGFPFFFSPTVLSFRSLFFLCNADIYIYIWNVSDAEYWTVHDHRRSCFENVEWNGKKKEKQRKRKTKNKRQLKKIYRTDSQRRSEGEWNCKKENENEIHGGGCYDVATFATNYRSGLSAWDICKFAWYILLSLHVYRKNTIARFCWHSFPSTNPAPTIVDALMHVARVCVRAYETTSFSFVMDSPILP